MTFTNTQNNYVQHPGTFEKTKENKLSIESHLVANIGYRTSNIRHRTSDIRHLTLDIGSLKSEIQVQCNVGCPSSLNLKSEV